MAKWIQVTVRVEDPNAPDWGTSPLGDLYLETRPAVGGGWEEVYVKWAEDE